MKKNRLFGLKFFLLAASSLGAVIIVSLLLSDFEKKIELIVSLASILVTAMLGIATYYQTKEQTQIDMLDKTPYFRIVKDTEYQNHATSHDVDANALYSYTKFLTYSNCGDGVGAVVTLVFENVSNCVIKRVTKYVCEGETYSSHCKFVKYNDTQLVKLCRTPDAKGYEFHNNFNLNQYAFDLIPNDTFELSVRLDDFISPEPKNGDKRTYDFSVALEIETVHGYIYTQYMGFSVEPVPIFTACNWVKITDYDVDITPNRIKKHFL